MAVLTKIVIWIVAILLLGCVGVGIYQGLISIYACLLFVCLGLTGCVFSLVNRRPKKDFVEQPPEQASALINPTDLLRANLAQNYSETFSALSIPQDAKFVVALWDIFSVDHLNLSCFLWIDEHYFYLFPRWESIESTFNTILSFDNNISNISFYIKPFILPIERIEYFSKEQDNLQSDGVTLLRYKNIVNESSVQLFDYDGYEVLKELIPKLELRLLIAKKYPNSAQQIVDITTKMQQLKSLHLQSLIDESEYNTKKAELLIEL